MPEKRKADELAGKGSLADRLRRRRIAMESGRPDQAAEAFKRQDKPSKKKE